MARNRSTFDTQNLTKLMYYRPTLADTASFFQVSPDTVERRIKDLDGCTFSEFREKHSFGLKQKLIRKALDMATNGNTAMMIFCLKNVAGWEDKPTVTNQTENRIIIDVRDFGL